MGYSWAILEGGPHDGKQLFDVDDNVNDLSMPETQDAVSFPIPATSALPKYKRHCYRRALYRPRVFTYQGVEP